MAPIGMLRNRYAGKKSGMAVVAMFVALAAVPVLAGTAQERVIGRLSSETSTGGGGQNAPRKEAIQAGTPASRLVGQEQEQGSYQEKVIRRLASETAHRAGSNSEVEEGLQPGAASLQESQDPQGYQQTVRNRLHGE